MRNPTIFFLKHYYGFDKKMLKHFFINVFQFLLREIDFVYFS
jgi:hypothetical protein